MTPPDEHDDDLLAIALASGKTRKQAAAQVGISETTVRRRLREPWFRRRVAELRRAIVDEVSGMLAAAAADAVAQIHLVCGSGEAEANRLRASAMILELTLKFQEQADLAERVRQLEEARGAGGSGGKTDAGGDEDRRG